MKFERKFGMGEVCIYNQQPEGCSRVMRDELVNVVAVQFEVGGITNYLIEFVNTYAIQRILIAEASLTGDPDFNQETGQYEEPDVPF